MMELNINQKYVIQQDQWLEFPIGSLGYIGVIVDIGDKIIEVMETTTDNRTRTTNVLRFSRYVNSMVGISDEDYNKRLNIIRVSCL